MATFDLNRIINLTQKVFGIPIDPMEIDGGQPSGFDTGNISVDNDPEVKGRRSFLNTPVYSNLVFPSGSYKEFDGNIIPFDEFRADAVLFTATKPRNIVKTPIAGRDGTVKEYISDGDYVIRVSGLLVSENIHSSPDEAMKLLDVISSVPESVTITSSFVNDLGIAQVVIENVEFAQIQGFTNMISVSLTMTSDFAVDIEISI